MTTQAIVVVAVLLVCSLAILLIRRKPTKTSVAQLKQTSKMGTVIPTVSHPIDSLDQAGMLDEVSLLENNPQYPYPDFYQSFKLIVLKKDTVAVIKDTLTAVRKPNPMLLALTKSTLQSAELYKLIKTDPQMSAQILKEVNSPEAALATPITSISHAINYLGAVKVKDIVIQCCVTTVDLQTKKQAAVCKKLWSISHVASSLVYIMARHLGESDPAQLATDTLLAYLGDQAIVAAYPDSADIYLNKDLSAIQKVHWIQTQYGVNSSMVGHALVSHWGLPKALVKKISQSQILMPDRQYEIGLSEHQLLQNLLCYISSRMAEVVVSTGYDDLKQLLPLTNESLVGLEFSNVQSAIKASNGYKLNDLMNNQQFINQANEVFLKSNHAK